MTTKIEEQALKSLTWKYFWQQKLREVGIFFGVVAGMGVFVLASYFIGNLIVKVLIMFSILVVFWVIFEFIKGNWETAQERATEKLKMEKNGKN